MYQNMSYAEREQKVKGLPCETCGRNVPDPSPSARRVWCWQCVLYGKYAGAEAQETRSQAPETVVERTPRSGGGSEAETTLENVANGKETLVFVGGKGDNTFTSNASGNVLVQDNKGVTTYDMKNPDHARIVTARLQRWLAKAKPDVSNGRVLLKGPKLDVRIKT